NRKHRTQLLVSPSVLELPFTVIGVVTYIGLHHAQVQLTGLDGIDVENRASGGLYRAAHAIGTSIFIDQTANRTARGVIHASHASRADTDKFLLGTGRQRAQ